MGLQKGPAHFGSLAPHRLADQASIWRLSSRLGPGALAGLRVRFSRGRGDWATDACADSPPNRSKARRPVSGEPNKIAGANAAERRSRAASSRALLAALSGMAQLHRSVSNRSKNMNEASSCKKCGVALYTLCAVCVLAGVPLNFSGFLKLGGLLIGLGVLTAVSTAIRLGHLKKW